MFAFDPQDYPDLPARGRPDTKPIYGFGGGRRRASITAAANTDASGSVHTLASIAAPPTSTLSHLFAHSEASSSRAPSPAPKKKKKKRPKKPSKPSQVLDLTRFDADFEAAKKTRAWEEPDWTFMKRPVAPSSGSSSRSSSPLRPSGLSSLLSQAHPADLVGSDTSVGSENGDAGVVETYEVALDEDYVNEEAGAQVERRKMHADDFEPIRCLGKGT